MPELSEQTKKLIEQYQLWQKSLQPKGGVSTIHVDEVASKVAAFYEKIRMVVDWKEEHLMRRAAITRKLKRRFLNWEIINTLSSQAEISEPLVLELIRGGHFPNDRIEETKIVDVQKVINKYIFILQNSPPARSGKEKLQFYNWLLEIAACEIEETLVPPIREKALINYMFELMKERIKVNEGTIKFGGLKNEEKDVQIYIAVQQALFKLDYPIISYNLLKHRYPHWNQFGLEPLSEITKNIYKIWADIEKDLSYPMGKKFYAICEKYDTPYLLLGDILSELIQENPAEVPKKISDSRSLTGLVKKAYNKRLSTLKKRLSRAAFYSTLSILITNSLSLFVLEIPLAKLITGRFTPITIVVDILGPTFLMFALTITISPPSKTNLWLVTMETMKIVYQEEKLDTYEIKAPKKRGFLITFIVGLVYILGAGVAFGAIYWVFKLANFPPTSVVINVIFVALISFAGLIIRKRAKELTVEERAGGFFGFLFDIIFLPVAGFGRWLARKWRKYNALAAFFDAFLDMPFQIFIEFLENWRLFLKEKKEEIH